ncbi:MAG: YdcF family protein [bacterium]|nr:YdcF family protein [bacterium]
MLISEIDPDALSRDETTRLLFGDKEARPFNGDCVFVFGGRGAARVAKAAELYNAGRAPIVLFSGGSRYGKHDTPTALRMKEDAIECGLPANAIDVECESDNTRENVLASLLVLDRRLGLHTIRRLLVVSIPWHMRRCLLTLSTYAPDWIEYTWCPADYRDHQPDTWWKHDEAELYVTKEVRTLVEAVRSGQLRDLDINLGR